MRYLAAFYKNTSNCSFRQKLIKKFNTCLLRNNSKIRNTYEKIYRFQKCPFILKCAPSLVTFFYMNIEISHWEATANVCVIDFANLKVCV